MVSAAPVNGEITSYFMADFEIALRTAIQNAFPNIEMKGCHFHYAQCIWKFVLDTGHKMSFSNSSEFATFVKCAIGMAFVPFLLVYFIFLLIPN